MNIPSHYQSAFFKTLAAREDIDLRVCYFEGSSKVRVAEGWKGEHLYQPYEACCDGAREPAEMLLSVPDWRERTHIISSKFSQELVAFFCKQGVSWCHWSEMPGIRLAEAVDFNVTCFRLLNPVMLVCKRREGRMIRQHATKAFAQGYLARKAFRSMGVPGEQIADLYYVPAPLEPGSRSEDITRFAEGRKVVLSVGVLCKRKGTDVLLKAFSRLRTDDWCLVLCGLDYSHGHYEALVRRLGIEARVLFLGAYPVEKISEVYAAADVFVLASRFDGWGAVLNEAASMGLPLIGSDLAGASWHLVENGVNGYRVNAGSVGKLHNALAAYVDDPHLLALHGDKSRQLFIQDFTPERNAQRVVHALHSQAKPLVSVVVPTYKRLSLLKRAIDSVCQQTYDNWELIVSDNEVPAGATWEYLTKLAGTKPNIKILQNQTGGGCAGNLNNALKHVQGEWIKPLFDDDVLLPSCLDAFVAAVSDYPNVVLAGCPAYRIRPNKPTKVDKSPTRAPLEVVEQRNAHLAMYLQDYECGGVPSQMFVRKSAIDAGAFMPKPANIEGALDSYWYAEILKHGDRLHVALPLIKEYQGGHETLTSYLGEDIPDMELLTYRQQLFGYIPEELNAPPPEIINQMIHGIKGLHKIFIARRVAAGMSLLSKVRNPYAMWLVFKWLLRRSFPGYFTATPRLRKRPNNRLMAIARQQGEC